MASNLVPHGTSSSMTSLSCTEQVLARLRTNLLSFALADIKEDLDALALRSSNHGIISHEFDLAVASSTELVE